MISFPRGDFRFPSLICSGGGWEMLIWIPTYTAYQYYIVYNPCEFEAISMFGRFLHWGLTYYRGALSYFVAPFHPMKLPTGGQCSLRKIWGQSNILIFASYFFLYIVFFSPWIFWDGYGCRERAAERIEFSQFNSHWERFVYANSLPPSHLLCLGWFRMDLYAGGMHDEDNEISRAPGSSFQDR